MWWLTVLATSAQLLTPSTGSKRLMRIFKDLGRHTFW